MSRRSSSRTPVDYSGVDVDELSACVHGNLPKVAGLVLSRAAKAAHRTGGGGSTGQHEPRKAGSDIPGFDPDRDSSVGLPVIVIAGPTGVGKSELAELVAARCGAEIVSADSMQVYRHMDIGTAKVMPDDRGVPYHCIDIVDPGDVYSAALYQRDAREAIAGIRARGRNVVVCGGTGLYIRAALDDMEFPKGEQVGNPVREGYERYAEENGPEALHSLLRERDPESAALIHPNNVRRVVRALEMLDDGKRYCEQTAGMREYSPSIDAIYTGLTMETPNLYAAIDARVEGMMRAGLLGEVRWLVDNGYRDAMTSMQAIGYKELLGVLDGSSSLEEAVEAIKRGTRRYSKRQRTWFRRDPRYVWYGVDSRGGEIEEQRP